MQAGKFYIFRRKPGVGTGTLLLLAITALLLFFSAGQRVPAQPYPQRKPVSAANYPEGWQQDLRLFETRWKILLADRKSQDKAPWAALESDLRVLAKRYEQHLEEHMRRGKAEGTPSPGNPVILSSCSARDDVPGYSCYLFAGPKGVCRYVCAPSKK